MQRLSDERLLAEIDDIMPQVAACEPSPETRRILKELELGRQNLLGKPVDSTAAQIAERALVLAQVKQHSELANRLAVIGEDLEHREYRRRVTRDEILKRLGQTSPDFWSLYHELRHWSQAELFEFLFPIASDCIAYPSPTCDLAAKLLISLDPSCPLDCREALVRIGGWNLEPSLRALPFYLVTQFGKHTVLKEVAELLGSQALSEGTHRNLLTVRYWAGMPASELLFKAT